MNKQKLLLDFIDWAANCGEEAFYIFDNPEEAVGKFLDNTEK